MEYIVITKVGAYPGNHATMVGNDIYINNEFSGDGQDRKLTEYLDPMLMIGMYQQVFFPGEILLCEDGREVGYPGRKPSKWDVTYEVFGTPEEAVSCARAVMDAENERARSEQA